MTDNTEVSIHVEPVEDGYEVVTRKDGKPWLRHGPFEDLDFANMICREMLKRSEAKAQNVTVAKGGILKYQDRCGLNRGYPMNGVPKTRKRQLTAEEQEALSAPLKART